MTTTRTPPVAPFELDPAALEPAQLVPEEEPGAERTRPAVIVPPPRAQPRPWLRLAAASGTALLLGLLGIEAYDWLVDLFARSAALGTIFSLLLALLVAGLAGLGARELLSLRRLAQVEGLRADAARLLGSSAHGQAEDLLKRTSALYRERDDVRAALEHYQSRASDALDDGEQIQLFARTVLVPLDRSAYQIVKIGARDVGALTALSPLGLLDSAIVFARTLAMLRAIARLYGVRPGAVATISLLRQAVRNVLVAGVGELLSDAAVETMGASLMSALSARAGQGVVNGLLTARLGLSAMQVCRPLPFTASEVPSLRQLRAEVFG